MQQWLIKPLQVLGSVLDQLGKKISTPSSQISVPPSSQTSKKNQETLKSSTSSLAYLHFERHLWRLMESQEAVLVQNLFPNLSSKKVLVLSSSTFLSALVSLEKNAQEVYVVDLCGAEKIRPSALVREDIYWIKASLKKIPLKNESFDFVVCNFNSIPSAQWSHTLQELYRVLKDHSKLLLLYPHPVLEMQAKQEKYQAKFEQVFDQLKKTGFFIEELKEVFLSQEFIASQTDLGIKDFVERQSLNPILFVLRALKYKKK